MSRERVSISEYEFNETCIYCIRNCGNDKLYIGSAKHYRNRINEHVNDLVKNKHKNPHLQRSFNSGAFLEVKILEKVAFKDRICREVYYCNKFDTLNKERGYNMLHPMEAPKFAMTEKHKRKMAIARAKKGYDTSHLRTPEVVRKGAEGKYRKVNIYYKSGDFFKQAKSLIEAEKLTNVHRANIGQNCREHSGYLKGFYFRYAEPNQIENI